MWDLVKFVRRDDSAGYIHRLNHAQAAMAHNDILKPRLMTLSAELRNIIYDLVFSTALKRVQNHFTHPFLLAADDDMIFDLGHEHPLLRTCRFLRADALPMWYGTRMYRFLQSESHLKDNNSRLTKLFDVDREVLELFEKWAAMLAREGRLGMILDLHVQLDCVTFTVKEGICEFYRTQTGGYTRIKDDVAAGVAIYKVLKAALGSKELALGRKTAIRNGQKCLEMAADKESVELGRLQGGGTRAELEEAEQS